MLPPVATTGWIFQTSAIGSEDNERNGSNLLNKVSFGQSFALAVPKSCVDSKTLLLTIWSVISRKDREDDEECLGSTQLSLADKDLFGTSAPIIPCWYNILNFHFMMGGVNNNKPSSNLNVNSSTRSAMTSLNTNASSGDKTAAKFQKPESQLSSRQGTLKEGESSDDSTIISSQTSTLTRNIDPEIILSTTNRSLKSSTPHGMISSLVANELQSSTPYKPFSQSPLNPNSLNYSSPFVPPSNASATGGRIISKLQASYATTSISKICSDVPPSAASSSSISSGPQQGSRQSTPFNTNSDKQQGNEDEISRHSTKMAMPENQLRQGAISSGHLLHKVSKSKNERVQEDTVTSTQQTSSVDKQTNTECVFLSPSAASTSTKSRGKSPHPTINTNTGLTVPSHNCSSVSSLVKRSQTFTPSAPINKTDYVCKVMVYIGGGH